MYLSTSQVGCVDENIKFLKSIRSLIIYFDLPLAD